MLFYALHPSSIFFPGGVNTSEPGRFLPARLQKQFSKQLSAKTVQLFLGSRAAMKSS